MLLLNSFLVKNDILHRKKLFCVFGWVNFILQFLGQFYFSFHIKNLTEKNVKPCKTRQKQ